MDRVSQKQITLEQNQIPAAEQFGTGVALKQLWTTPELSILDVEETEVGATPNAVETALKGPGS